MPESVCTLEKEKGMQGKKPMNDYNAGMLKK
jgi:hypothetical protein